MDVFKNMQLFVAVAKSKSFRRAGEELDLPSSTVSRRIAELEREVGLRLLNRTTRRVELTDSGLQYFENCQRIVAEAELAYRALTQLHDEPRGLIRASVPVDFSLTYLSPILAEFSRLYPAIEFNLDLTPTQADLVGDPVDFAIRIGAPKDQTLIARPIAKIDTLLLASPAYLHERGYPRHPQDLVKHSCLRTKDAPWQLMDRQGNSHVIEVSGTFVANNPGLLLQLALAGRGIIRTARTLVQPDLDAGRLVHLLARWSSPPVEVYAITTTRLLPAKVRLFLDFLVARMAQGAAPLGSEGAGLLAKG